MKEFRTTVEELRAEDSNTRSQVKCDMPSPRMGTNPSPRPSGKTKPSQLDPVEEYEKASMEEDEGGPSRSQRSQLLPRVGHIKMTKRDV